MFFYVSQLSIYALRLSSEHGYRYVGQTSKTLHHRLTQHARSARSGSTQPVHEWMREHGPDNVVCELLESCTDLDYLNYAERYWIRELRYLGHGLLNAVDGGAPGSRGLQWSAVQREGVTGEGNPFFGRKHSDETRERMSSAAPRTSGPEHHLFGKQQTAEHVAKRVANYEMSPEARERARKRWSENNPSTQRDITGPNNSFFGKTHSEETLAKMRKPRSEAGKAALRLSAHKRWHKDKPKPGCQYCENDG